jgi:hypothetical protein
MPVRRGLSELRRQQRGEGNHEDFQRRRAHCVRKRRVKCDHDCRRCIHHNQLRADRLVVDLASSFHLAHVICDFGWDNDENEKSWAAGLDE